jgi:hypothetical protein
MQADLGKGQELSPTGTVEVRCSIGPRDATCVTCTPSDLRHGNSARSEGLEPPTF